MNHRFSELSGRRVFLTGHTGFTGSWASIWLRKLGCEVYGYSLEPDTDPSLFLEAGLGEVVSGKLADIRDFETLKSEIWKFQPDLVLHLAAQPLVRKSYRMPRETFEVNAQGTANLLEAARGVSSIRGILCITTDKVYKNLETDHKYQESDELGGKDPYSASKAAAEIVISSYRSSFNSPDENPPVIAVARGGNIIGGGDWSEDRLIPDYMRALTSDGALEVRFPEATRPWQHVISLVDGYLSILEGILGKGSAKFNRAFNLGPLEQEAFSVSAILSEISKLCPGVEIELGTSRLHEAGKLGLDSALAVETFGWGPKWSTHEVVEQTALWYKRFFSGEESAFNLCSNQIDLWVGDSQ